MVGLLSGLVNNVLSGLGHNCMSRIGSNLLTNSIETLSAVSQVRHAHTKTYKQDRNPYRGQLRFNGKAVQEWWDWDGLGPYKYRHHYYPNNITQRDVQKRRIFKKRHYERSKLQDVVYNDVLPKEIRDKAFQRILEMPFDSSIIRLVDRCCVTGRARGNLKEYRVSRFIFRNEADHNRVSGCQRAFWDYNTHLKP